MNRSVNRLLEGLVSTMSEAAAKCVLYPSGDGFKEVFSPGVYDSHLLYKNGAKVEAAARSALADLKDKISTMSASDVFKYVDEKVGKQVKWNSKSYPD